MEKLYLRYARVPFMIKSHWSNIDHKWSNMREPNTNITNLQLEESRACIFFNCFGIRLGSLSSKEKTEFKTKYKTSVNFDLSQQFDPAFPTSLMCLFRPYGSLDFTDMRFLQKEHTDPGLADSTSNRVGQLFLQKCSMKGQKQALLATGDFNLLFQSVFINPDTHGGHFESGF